MIKSTQKMYMFIIFYGNTFSLYNLHISFALIFVLIHRNVNVLNYYMLQNLMILRTANKIFSFKAMISTIIQIV
jgi:hypothetical protein